MEVIQFAHPKLILIWFTLLCKMLAIVLALKVVTLVSPEDRKIPPGEIAGL